MGARVLVVDDDVRAASATAELLRRAGYAVDVALGGREAVDRVRALPPDLMLLDFDMSDMDAAEVLDELKGPRPLPGFPVLILTGARLSSGDQAFGLDHGASDYILKGVDRQILLARVRRALREREGTPREVVRGRLRLDPEAATVQLDGRALAFEPKPFWVLYHLALREGVVVSRAELLRVVWRSDYQGFEHAVEQAVYAVRRALGEPGWIQTVPRFGYRFVTLG
jgi:DNA-binding response OmpR family regulator